MRLTCQNKPVKFKNLTLNKEYEATEDGEVFVVTNDAGFRARYAKNYFRVLPEAPVERRLLDALTVEFDNEDGVLTITLNRTTRTVSLAIDNSIISCGIDEIEGISGLKRTVNEMYAAKVATLVGTKAEMFEFILGVLFTALREGPNRMCWLLSDQVRTSDTELDAVLTEMADATSAGINPNNNNNIILWVIK